MYVNALRRIRARIVCGSSLFLALCLSLLLSRSALAASGIYQDGAHVLDEQKVMAEANNLPRAIDIYTTNSFNGDQDAFEDDVKVKADDVPDHFVLGIDTAHRYFWIQGGSNIHLEQSQYDAAYQAFKSKVGSNNYTDGVLAVLRSLKSSLEGGNTSKGFWEDAHNMLICLGGIVLGGVIVIFNKLTGGRFRGRRRYRSWHGGGFGGGGSFGGGGGGGGGAGGSF